MAVSALPANLAKIGELVLTVMVDFMNGFFVYAIIFTFLMGAIVKKSKIFGNESVTGATGRKSKTMEEKVGQLFGLAIAILMARMYPLKVWAGGWVLPLLVGTIFGVIAFALLEKFLGEAS